MGLDKQKKGQIGVNAVERIVLCEWKSRWQPLDGHNDDGIDGLIFLESSSGELTGQIVFAQVKCIKKKRDSSGKISIPIEADRLKKNIQRWKRIVGAAILVHVDPDTLKASWVNLDDESIFTASQIKVPANQSFDKDKRKIAALCGSLYRDVKMPKLETKNEDFSYLTERVASNKGNIKKEPHPQVAARRFYKDDLADGVRLAGNGPLVQFSREGWRHITRPARARLVVLQSFQLLGVARKLLLATHESDLRDIASKDEDEINLKYIMATVTFPHRHTAVVKLILREHAGENGKAKYSFYTIYEPRRRKDILGRNKAQITE